MIVGKKVGSSDEVEKTIDHSPSYELYKKFKRCLGHHTSDPSIISAKSKAVPNQTHQGQK